MDSVLLLLFLSLICHFIVGYHVDPSDFFLGAQHRPKLEIISPENGEVLDDVDLEIRIRLGGYELPSSFHDSKVCIALSTGIDVTEGCFEQTAELVYHANGLSPGQQYSLQVSFYERGKAIAVSVRNFRVAGIRGLLDGSNDPVTIMTAVQLAIQYQTHSMMQQAENIYRTILNEYPTHANALHLMGVMLYQKGEPLAAIPYIQQAMRGNKTDESFYNTLGECYRDLGRTEEAIEQYKAALGINPKMLSALFNLGRAYQELRMWDNAIEYYRRVQELIVVDYTLLEQKIPVQKMREDALVRECDLLQASKQIIEAVDCWKRGMEVYPNNHNVYNELGNMLGQNGQYEEAFELFRIALSKGSIVAELNAAHMLEQLGYYVEAITAYDEAINVAHLRGTPEFHIQVRKAMVLPRILPSSVSLLHEIRKDVESNLDDLLSADAKIVSIDNSPPLYFGYSLGYYLAFHGVGPDNVVLKSKLHRVYARMCPALLQGYFMDKTSDQMGSDDTSLVLSHDEDEDGFGEDNAQDRPRMKSQSHLLSTSGFANAENNEVGALGSLESLEYDAGDAKVVAQETLQFDGTIATGTSVSDARLFGEGYEIKYQRLNDRRQSSIYRQQSGSSNLPAGNNLFSGQSTKYNSPWHNNVPHQHDKSTGRPLIRLGFISRFMQLDHAAGAFVHGLIPLLASANFEVIVFHIDAISNRTHSSWDVVKSVIQETSHVIGYLPLNLGDCATVIRAAEIDVLVFPEIGMDPFTYFLSYSRLAPIQAVWLGHPDTTGVSTVDYFIGSDVQAPEDQTHYTEKLFRMRNLGTAFVDTYQQYSSKEHSSPRTSILERARFIEEVRLPRSAHLYVIAQPIDRLHPDFDAVLAKILTQDKLGYLMFVDPSSSTLRRTWKNLFVMRLAGTFSNEIRDRILFIHPSNHTETLRIISVGHVVLDPFPVSGLLSNLHALALGVPVVTWPSDRLGGRFALALYKQLDLFSSSDFSTTISIGTKGTPSQMILKSGQTSYKGSSQDTEQINLIVNSVHEYVNAAMSITHKPKLRDTLVRDINSKHSKLFDDVEQRVQTVSDWKLFVETAMKDAMSSHRRSDKRK